MTARAPTASAADIAPSGLEPFLFAEIGKEENGMMLTVASAFARLGLDPWHQAAVLARLSDVAAAASLAALLGRTELAPRADALAIASRLVALLPRNLPNGLPGGDVSPKRRENGVPALDARGSRIVWLFWAAIAAAAAYMVWF